MLPPAPSSFPAHLVIILIVVFVGGSIALSAILYQMTSELIRPPPINAYKPVVTLMASKTPSGADVLVAGIQPTASPSNFRVNIEDVSTATFGTAAALPTTPYGSAGLVVGTDGTQTAFSIQWQNPGGSGQVSQGDHFMIAATGAYASGTMYTFFLLWADGSILTSIDWTV